MIPKKFSIKNIFAHEILDSRGNPTLEVELELANGTKAKAGVPSGASTGAHEAVELRDGNLRRYGGKGVLRASENVSKIGKRLNGVDARDQAGIDASMMVMDGTLNKSNLGANAILGVSIAAARAAAAALEVELHEYLGHLYHETGLGNKKRVKHHKVHTLPSKITKRRAKGRKLPTPMFNIFNGGAHADTNMDVQEIMVVPLSNTTVNEKVRMGSEIFSKLGVVLKENGHDTDVGNEGGYAPDVDSVVHAFDLVLEAIKRSGFVPGKEVGMALDVAATEFFDERHAQYRFRVDDNFFISDQMISLYYEWLIKYPIISLEDPFAEDDFEGLAKLTHELVTFSEKSRSGKRLKIRKSLPRFRPMIVGDDHYATDVGRLERAVVMGAGNAVIVKANQVGTLTETFAFAHLAQAHSFPLVVSHRSGETNDAWVTDLAVAIGAEFLKAGAPSRGERVAKYNRLMEIEEQINK